MRGSWKWCAAVLLAVSFVVAQDVAPVKHEQNALNSKKALKAHYVVMVSLDGFRWDYAAKRGAPHLEEIAAAGVSAQEGLVPGMKAIFYAEGPDVRPGVKLKSFENVNVYDFVCGILGLKPAPNDGDEKVLKRARR